jgi:glutamine synthetase
MEHSDWPSSVPDRHQWNSAMALASVAKTAEKQEIAGRIAEISAFLKSNPAVESIDCVFVDMCGSIRGKRLPRSEIEKVYKSGLQIPLTIYLLDARGETTDATGRGFGDGDPDGVAWPVPGSIRPLAWTPRPHAQVLMSVLDNSHQPYFAEPRNVLARVLERFDALDLKPVIAAELEFFALDPQRTDSGAPQPPLIPGTTERESSISVYGIEDLDRYHSFLDAISEGARVQGVPTSAASAEHAPGQFEVNLHHRADALLAADDAIYLKQIVRLAARAHGMDTSFMAKPYLGRPGSGLHVHVSVAGKLGSNVFDDGSQRGSDVVRHAVAGLQAIMGEAMAVFAPNVNSYRRFVANAFTPMNRRWGYNNRSTGLRIPGGPNEARRIEHRVSGADANPYLAIAAVLAGIHHGIVNRLDPGAPTEGNASGHADDTVPFNIDAALDAMAKGGIMSEYFGSPYVEAYCATKRIELARFRNCIPKAEFDWYL